MKLNDRKVQWIISQKEKRVSSSEIARSMHVTVQYVNSIWKNYREIGKRTLREKGPKPHQITDAEIQAVMEARQRHPNAGAIAIENYLMENGLMISHNRIHRILIESGMAMEDPNKKKQRKWVRYERKHSNSLWHMDWAEYREEQLLVIEDDASRYIVGFGSFDSATTENSLIVLRKAIEEHGKPREIMTDHGTQFFSNGKNGEPGGPNEFQRFLESEGIRHILARVKHPQTNGKLERFNGTLKGLRKHFGTWEEVVYYYNNERRHMSLSDKERPVVTPAMAYEEKMNNGEEEEAV
ncbi:hypothetical protein IX51_09445 [uncultured archaeon]|nr:hypothetical protein IX51_09445 [uncultured archaeon]